MRCLHCGKRIGLLRSLQDRQFCSDDHRLRAKRMYSARLARGSSVDYEDGWVVTANEIQGSEKKPQASFGVGSGVLLVVITLSLTLLLPHSDHPMPQSLRLFEDAMPVGALVMPPRFGDSLAPRCETFRLEAGD